MNTVTPDNDDILHDRRVEIDPQISCEFFDTIKNKWYGHSTLFVDRIGFRFGCKTWRDPWHSSIMFLSLRDHKKHNVYFFDDRSNCKQWIYDFEKTQELANLNATGFVGS